MEFPNKMEKKRKTENKGFLPHSFSGMLRFDAIQNYLKKHYDFKTSEFGINYAKITIIMPIIVCDSARKRQRMDPSVHHTSICNERQL